VITRLALGQGRKLDGKIGDEGRLDQGGLDQGVEDLVPEADRRRAGLGRGHPGGHGRLPELALVGSGTDAEPDATERASKNGRRRHGPPEFDVLALVTRATCPRGSRGSDGRTSPR
jgi:hypothetical protein